MLYNVYCSARGTTASCAEYIGKRLRNLCRGLSADGNRQGSAAENGRAALHLMRRMYQSLPCGRPETFYAVRR